MMPTLLPARKMAEYIRNQNPNCMISESYLRNLVREGEIGVVKSGSRLLISYEEVEEYINTQLAK